MKNNLVITGIPRSGTSYVCALLNNLDNTVIINEPQEIFSILHNNSQETLNAYYDATRARIINKEPIENKIVNGKFTEDTNECDSRNYHVPDINDPGFVLGTKNTLIYLVSINKIRQQLPGARIVAFVRHPYDTIASWKNVSFPHLRRAAPLFLKDYVDAGENAEITRICATGSLAARYSLLWNYLAVHVIDCIDNVILMKYEEFVVDPARHLTALYNTLGIPAGQSREIPASVARRHENALTVSELEHIRENCSRSAGYFGYEL